MTAGEQLPEIAFALERHVVRLAADAEDLDGMILGRVGGPSPDAAPGITIAGLGDHDTRIAFTVSTFTHHRLRVALDGATKPADALVRAHSAHKFLSMAHSPDGQKRLGRHVASGGAPETYVAQAMAVLGVPTSRGKHVNVLQHILGYIAEHLTPDQKFVLHSAIDTYTAGRSPRSAPLTLLRDHIRTCAPDGWIASQVYLEPFPLELDAG